ncbi:MAG: twin-arginine translocase subunit TatC [Chlorobium sp.]|jgi:sec-independent protein translocase protein TatC|uniref:twin-arginine translocase subunit TatC n=1 Tax=Chlorobium sp. TaxID=1095 RepID=UPI001D1C6FAA|nr:twin-arginine translocase subunit TatC [Chlorobium sp.]MBN1279548.1 twin-arginine translocase subunit TatC [Chlorobiaceae bacterium]MCF8215838.1 twin-arginine translocase subunit TatC [Chlorobium sp.]MCF8270736.1 twin-arginine translocase subunit TatC [Chlorobium sp.]MCF8287048.1 twin-arginine translocase subunit TatC [Chlorobium sp.]MCF8290705.1 twin-arginine translocase subunit TatC [Chlorobium sp.]
MTPEIESTKNTAPDPEPSAEKTISPADGVSLSGETEPATDTKTPSESLVGEERESVGTEPPEDEEGEMNFIGHLDEIRSRLIKAGIALITVTALAGIFADTLVNEVLIGPLKRSSETITLQNLVPYGQISIYLQVIFFTGFVGSFPFIAYQIWKFVEPGLHENERQASRFVILFISLCFFSGIAFGYFVFLPISLTFFAGFGSTLIANNIAIQDYISFVMGALLTTGLVFELPFISFILSKIGLLTPAFMRFYRKHAIVTLLIIAAIVTPSTDLVTQLVIGIPMILLYELSIWISSYVNRKNNALKYT